MISKALLMTCALVAVTGGSLARGDDMVPPPSRMQGGVAVELIDPLPPGVERIKVGDVSALVFTGDVRKSSRRIAEILAPYAAAGGRYLVKGWIRYANVEVDGFIEMWSHFGERAFFSRTLSDGGPMGEITGSREWRVFALPFVLAEGMKPDRLEVNLVLPGKGTVTIADLRLVDFGAAD